MSRPSKLKSDGCYHYTGRAIWGMLQGKGGYGEFAVKQLCDPYLSASEASFSQWNAIQIQFSFPIHYTINTIQIVIISWCHTLKGNRRLAVELSRGGSHVVRVWRCRHPAEHIASSRRPTSSRSDPPRVRHLPWSGAGRRRLRRCSPARQRTSLPPSQSTTSIITSSSQTSDLQRKTSSSMQQLHWVAAPWFTVVMRRWQG